MNIFKKTILIFLLICSLEAKNLEPTLKLQVSGAVTDMVISNNRLFVSTASSAIDIFDLKSNENIGKIEFPKIKDFAGDLVDTKLYSVDVLDDSVLIVSQGEKGGRALWTYKNKELQNIVSDKKKLYITVAKFVSKTQVAFATLGNQLFLYDLKKSSKVYSKQIGHSKFSHFSLNDEKTDLAVADESGDIKLIDIKSGNITKVLTGQNLDNVFKVDWKKSKIITAGQDRRSVVYDLKTNSSYIKNSDFLVYSCALSQNLKRGAYSSDEQNNVTVFDMKSKKDLYRLTNNMMTTSKIIFSNENSVFVGTDDKVLNFYRLN